MNKLKDILRPIKFVAYFIGFCFYLFRLIVKSNRSFYFRQRLLKVLFLLIKKLEDKESEIIKTTEDSKAIYEQYDDRDIRDERANLKELMLVKDRVEMVGAKDRRLNHLQYLNAQIEMLLKTQDRVSVLEVGCGNLSNAHHTKARFGDRVVYKGIEISPNRLTIGLKAYPDLKDSDFSAQSITEKTSFNDSEFDIVFSMHCLEQIAYDSEKAVYEMNRVTKQFIVMIEPVFENGNFLQRAYLMLSDHTRILLRSIQKLKLRIVKNEVCEMQTNIDNQSTLLVISKT